jgi:hypothetical protein
MSAGHQAVSGNDTDAKTDKDTDADTDRTEQKYK